MAAPENVKSEIRAIVGPKGVIAGPDAEPLLHELRGWWPGKASLVVAPADAEEVAGIVRLCAREKIAITPQGGNTGLVGGQHAERALPLPQQALRGVHHRAASIMAA